MITPEMIKKYETSHRAQDAIKCLESFDSSSSLLSMAEHTQIRNFIMVNLAINNATRAGGVTNLTLGNFKQAEFFQAKKNFIAKVSILSIIVLKLSFLYFWWYDNIVPFEFPLCSTVHFPHPPAN